jgi:hypothetical protein
VPSSPSRGPRPRKREIEAAIADYNAADRALLLTPDAVRLLTVMFSRSSVRQRALDDLATEGFNKRTVSFLLRSLVEAGFVSKERGHLVGAFYTYRLHLPPVWR